MTGSKHATWSLAPTPIYFKWLISGGIACAAVFIVALASVIWAGTTSLFVIGLLVLGIVLGITFIALGMGWIPTTLGFTRSVEEPPADSGERSHWE
jgi:hypothetical protein